MRRSSRPYGRLEPSNAQALEASVERARALRATYDRIEAASPLLRPVVALYDAIESPGGRQGSGTADGAPDTYVPQVVISTASATYGLTGLVLGSFLAEALVSTIGGLGRRWNRAA